ncbi:sulfhydrogenase subunit delta [Francisella halioticida]|uniref:Sulfhydrogenase subunit delta n=1 Tax=Francisella halioticida TaxID=549298 RepID=A0ABN5ATK6_9GAMM|nr:sulfhydrogenase subunit delta [Francisella halioticida]ASG67004.1 sulfhydrogenase subunit delta [Francisella halioticida]BCD92335.1 sulfhydrogenase subunit delta [Francisella halioticida]
MSAQDKLKNLAPHPKIAVHKFSSCDGCQLALLNDAVSLITLAEMVDIVHFAEAGPLDEFAEVDIAFIEGSVNTHHDIPRLEKIREKAKYIVAIGACAIAGGIQALRNFTNEAELLEWQKAVYPQETQVIIDGDLSTAKAIKEYVNVDFEISGCPITTEQIIKAIRQLLFGVEPEKVVDPVCTSCKHAGVTCVMVAKDEPCLGPVIADGCGAICPKLGRGCYGCFGASKYANLGAMTHKLKELGLSDKQIHDKYKFISSQDDVFKKAGV